MSGHNKWSQIKRQKGASDVKKSKIFSKLSRLIGTQVKLAGGNRNATGVLAAIEKARSSDMPVDTIERAIKKGSEPGENLETIIYEAYGPGGVAIIIEALTSNRNKAAQEIKFILGKHNATLAAIGSVAWAFTHKRTPEGLIYKPNSTVPLSLTDGEKLNALIDELEENDEVQEVFMNAE